MATKESVMAFLQNQDQFKSPAELRQWYIRQVKELEPEAKIVQPPASGTELVEEDFINWGNSVSTKKVLAGYPFTREDVQAIIRRAKVEGKKVRVAGQKHSWSPVFCDNPGDIIIYTERLKLPEGKTVELNPIDKTARLSGCASSGDLKACLDEYNSGKPLQDQLCLPSNAIVKTFSMCGIVTCACHGTGRGQPTISEWVTEIQLIDANGDLKTFNSEDQLKAVRASLGLFGVIVEQTIKLQPNFKVKVRNRYPKIKDFTADELKRLLTDESIFSVQIYWYPYNSISQLGLFFSLLYGNIPRYLWSANDDELWVREVHFCDPSEPVSTPEIKDDIFLEEQLNQRLWEEIYNALNKPMELQKEQRSLEKFQLQLSNIIPLLSMCTHRILKMVYDHDNSCEDVMEAVHYLSSLVLYVPALDDLEFFMDLNEQDCSLQLKCFTDVKDYVQSAAPEGNFPLSSCVDMRFFGISTNTLLSPAQYTSATTTFEVLSWKFFQNHLDFFKTVAAAWKRNYAEAGRPKIIPHWGKQWQILDDALTYFEEGYGSKLQEFKAIRSQANVDPNNMFVNNELKKIFKFTD